MPASQTRRRALHTLIISAAVVFGIAIPVSIAQARCRDVSASYAQNFITRFAAKVFPVASACGKTYVASPSYALNVSRVGSGTITGSGINCPGTCAKYFIEGTNVALTPTPGAGYSFSGWSEDCSGNGNCTVNMNEAKTVTATFTQNAQQALTIHVLNPGSVSVNPPTSSCLGDCTYMRPLNSTVSLDGSGFAGWSFGNWSGDCTGTSSHCDVTMNGPKDVTMILKPNLTTTAVNNGTITLSPTGANCEQAATNCTSFNLGSTVTVTPNPEAGAVFEGWSGACIGTGACVVTMDGPKNVIATFSPLLNVALLGRGIVTSTPAGLNCHHYTGAICTWSFAIDTEVTLHPESADLYIFDGWSGDCSGLGDCALTVNGPLNVTAHFKPRLSISWYGVGTFTLNDSIVCTDNYCANYFDVDSVVKVEWTPGNGWSAVTWLNSPCAYNANPCYVTMDFPMDILARFDPNYWVTATPNGIVHANLQSLDCATPDSTCQSQVPLGAMVTLTAEPNVGHSFNGWSDENDFDIPECPNSSNVCTTQANQPRHITASFN